MRHIENRLEATPGTAALLDSGQQGDESRGTSKPRGGNQQSPAKSSSRSPLRNATQDSNVRKNSNVEFREPLASYETTPPSHPFSQLEAYNLQSVPGSSYTSSLPSSDPLPSQLIYQRDTRDKQTDGDLDSIRSSALESAEVRYLNDQPVLDSLKTEHKAQLVMDSRESKSFARTPSSSRQGESTPSSSPGSVTQRLENLRRHQPDDKLEKLKERIRRQRQHLEETTDKEKSKSCLEKPIVAFVEGDNVGSSSMPAAKIRKVTAAPPAPIYKFNSAETKVKTPDGKVWKEEEFHNVNRKVYRDISHQFSSSKFRHQHQRTERSKEKRPSKPVRKVQKVALVSEQNFKPISPASWREGQKLVKMVLGPAPKLPSEEHSSHPAGRQTRTRSASPTTCQPDNTDKTSKSVKKRHYDADTVRQYIAQQQEERKRRQAEEKRAEKEETAKRSQRLQELYKKQKEVVRTATLSSEAVVGPVQKRLQETYTRLLLEDRPMYQPSGESDKENKKIGVSQSPSSSDKSLNEQPPNDLGFTSVLQPDHLNPAFQPTSGVQVASNEHLLSQLLRLEAALASSNRKYTEQPAAAPHLLSPTRMSRIEALKAKATSLSNRIETEARRFAGQGINYGAATSMDVDTVLQPRTSSLDVDHWTGTVAHATESSDFSFRAQKAFTNAANTSYTGIVLPGAGNPHHLNEKTHTSERASGNNSPLPHSSHSENSQDEAAVYEDDFVSSHSSKTSSHLKRGPLQYSPAVLQQRMAAELQYLESIEESIKQLGDVEKLMGVSMAQQESASLTQMLKQHRHEQELYELKIKTEREALETKLQLEENRQRVARAHLELQENLATSQKQTLEGLQESTSKMMSQQTEAARYTADAARHIKEDTTSVATEYSLKFDESMTEDEIEERSFRSLLPSEAHRRGTMEKKSHHQKEGDAVCLNEMLVPETGSCSSFKSHDAHIAFSGGQDSFSQFTMEMVRQYMRDEEVRLQHQSSLLHLRQKALKEKTRTEVAWLEHQKDKGEDDKMPPIRKKQRGLLLKLQQEQAEIRRLQEANRAARKERQLLLKQQEEIERMRNSTLRLKERLKCAEGDIPPETPVSEPSGSELSQRLPGEVRTSSPSLSISGSETSSIMQKLKKMRSHMDEHCSPVHYFFSVFTAHHWASLSVCLPNLHPKFQLFIYNQLVFLTKREQQLMQRRHHAEELLQWKQQLDKEEAEVRRMEKEAVAAWEDNCSSITTESSIHTEAPASQHPLSASSSSSVEGSHSPAASPLDSSSKTKMQPHSTSRTHREVFPEVLGAATAMPSNISDQSDIESRIKALREELKKRKIMAHQLKKEQKKRHKERLKAQEATLLKKLENYNNFIEKTKAELNKEPDSTPETTSHINDSNYILEFVFCKEPNSSPRDDHISKHESQTSIPHTETKHSTKESSRATPPFDHQDEEEEIPEEMSQHSGISEKSHHSEKLLELQQKEEDIKLDNKTEFPSHAPAFAPPIEDEMLGFHLGDRVLVGGVQPGTLRFKGPTSFANGFWAGVELDKSEGSNNGTYDGVVYFECEESHGIFAPPDKVSHLPDKFELYADTTEDEDSFFDDLSDKGGKKHRKIKDGSQKREDPEMRNEQTSDKETKSKDEMVLDENDQIKTKAHLNSQHQKEPEHESPVFGPSGQEKLAKRLAELELSRELLEDLGDDQDWFDEDFGLSSRRQQQRLKQKEELGGELGRSASSSGPHMGGMVSSLGGESQVKTPPRPELPLPLPPKLPEQPAMVVPHSATEVEKMVHSATQEIWETFDLAVYDLTWEILKEIFAEDPNTDQPQWVKPRQVKSSSIHRVEFVTEEVLKLYGLTQDENQKTDWQKMLKFGRKKRDRVDHILELHEEEAQWVNYDEDELFVKIQLADSIFEALLKDTVNIFTLISDKR
uniref:Centrosomal protein 350 n=1 Tax=Xiphophorus couchianus TaxID=32473 RepID=A0A3B5KRC6_9TELE